ETLTIVTSNCGSPVERMGKEKMRSLFSDLEENFGVVHDDPFLRNITYSVELGRFCIIDFELAQVLDLPSCREACRLDVRWEGASEAGTRKERNEDALAAFSSSGGWAQEQKLSGCLDLEEEGIVFVVSDGMGGAKGGAEASRLVVSELRRFLPGRMGEFRDHPDPPSVLQAAVMDLQDHVLRVGKANAEWEGMGATMVAGLLDHSHLWFAHVGDSRLYCYRQGELTQLTHDHSMVGRAFREGKINEREARTHPQRHVLNRIIGARGLHTTPQIGSLVVEPGDYFLFCSDGLIDGLWDKHIKGAFDQHEANEDPEKQLSQLLSSLVDKAVEEAGRDDTTAFVLHCSDHDCGEEEDRQ
ncbi:MAG: protein phosphatase 2C domain-containing protein, partial [Verrucomicrobiota bacterium]